MPRGPVAKLDAQAATLLKIGHSAPGNACPLCGGGVRIIECIEDPLAVQVLSVA